MGELRSIRTKIFAAVTIIVALVAVIVMAASQDAVETVVVAAEERAVTNVLNLVEDNVRGRYRTLLMQKVETIQASKQQLRDFGAVVTASLDGFAAMAQQGLATEDEAQAMARAWLRSVVPVAGEALVAFSPEDRVLVDTRLGLGGRKLEEATDFKGRLLPVAARDEAGRYGESILTFRLSDDGSGVKYGHFFVYRPWNWVVGTIADLGGVQDRIDAQVGQLRSELAGILPAVRLAGDGTMFAFQGDGTLIAAPQGRAATAVTPDALARLAAVGDGVVTLTAPDGGVFEGRAHRVKALDWYIGSVVSRDALRQPAEALLGRQAVIFVVTLGLGLLVAFLLAHHLAQPLNRLALHAKSLPERDFAADGVAADAAATAALPVHRADEIGRLAEAFVFMEEALHRNVRSLMEATAARQRIEGELNVAHDIQMGLLPKVFPAFPNRPEIELFSTLIPAKEVGGDLFDYYFLDDEHLCFTIGDVAGKGIPAALFMAIAKTLIKVAAEKDRDPGAMAARVNDDLSRDNPNTIFVTLVIGVLNVRTGEINYANLGHNPPMILRGGAGAGAVEVARAISGPAAGVMDGLDYGPLSLTLQPGDTLFLYTDGVTEAMDPAHVLYGEDRLLGVLGAAGAEPEAAALVGAVMDDVRLHADGAEQSDDITILAIKYRGPQDRDMRPESP